MIEENIGKVMCSLHGASFEQGRAKTGALCYAMVTAKSEYLKAQSEMMH